MCVNLSLVCLVPCDKLGLEHALSDVTDNFSVSLPAVLLVTFACEGPRLHDQWCDFASGEHRAFLHFGDLHFGEGLCGG